MKYTFFKYKKYLFIFVLVIVLCILTQVPSIFVNTSSAQVSSTFYKAVNINGAQQTVDGQTFGSEASSGVTYPLGVTKVTKTTPALNPATGSTPKTTMIQDYVWRGTENTQLEVEVTVANGIYLVYLYTWEDNAAITYNIALEDDVVAINYSSGAAGSWQRIGPFDANVYDGKLSISQSGGDFNLSGVEIWKSSLVQPTMPAPTATPMPSFQTISLRAKNAPNTEVDASSYALNKPTGTVEGDVMLAHIILNSGNPTITPPTGWTLIRKTNTENSNLGSAIYYRVATASEPTSYSWRFSSSATATGGIATYTGVDNANPIDAHSGQFNSGTTTMQAPAVTTTTTGDRLVFFSGLTEVATVTGPSSMTQQWKVGSANQSFMADRAFPTRGSTGNISATNNSDESNVSQLVALRPGTVFVPTLTPPPSPTPTPIPALPGNIINLNFYQSNFNPWIRNVCGDFRMDTGINNAVPAGQLMMGTTASCSKPGLLYSGDSPPALGQGQASSTNEIVGSFTYPEVYVPPGNGAIFSAFDYLTSKAKAVDTAPINLATKCTLSNCTLPAALPQGIYTATGDVSLNAYTFPANQDYVFLIDGNLTIRGNVLTPNGSSAFFATDDNIIVPATVGSAATSGTANLSGIYSADKSFIVQGTSACNDLRLNFEGVLIVNAERSGGKLQNDRDLCGDNLTNPTIQFTQRLDFVLNMPEFVRIQRASLEEVAP